MRRFEERKQDLLNATERLKEALKQEENDIVIDCVLHRFEFTFELAWNIKTSIWKSFDRRWRRMDRHDACKK